MLKKTKIKNAFNMNRITNTIGTLSMTIMLIFMSVALVASLAASASATTPTITSISPISKNVGDTTFTMTVTGTNFISGSKVRFDGSDRKTTYVSSTSLTTSIATSDMTVAGTHLITVYNGGGSTSNSKTFTVNNLVPTTTNISPNSKNVGDTTFTMTVTGTNFISGSKVRFDGSDRTTTYVSGTSLTASIPTSDMTVAGTHSITVFNPTPGGGTSNAQTFTVNNPSELHLRKLITNDNGGTAVATDFTLSASGPTPLSGITPVDSGAGFLAGTYTLSETGPSGYTATAWVCVGGTQSGDQITVGLGESATCTITNDDNAPGLHLRKDVTNDNGGTAQATAWTLNATGPTLLSGTTPVDSGAGFLAGTYTLSESGPTGYTASAWVCVGGTQNGSQITVSLGESATCTITNDDNVVVIDNTPPVITRLGSNPVTVYIGTVYVDAGATAWDDVDHDITSSIVTVNPVNTSAVHTYIVTYNVNDSSHNAAVQVTRTVNVVYPCAPSFSDVPCTHWAYSSIEYLKAHGVTSGYPDLTFKPDNQITRAEIATFMVMAMGLTYTGGETAFPDVPSTHWAYSFIMAAKQHGIVSGYPDGTFKPDNLVTRTEISVMVTLSRSWTYGGTVPDFTDVPTTFWGYPYIMASKEHGVIGGYPDGTFKPNNQASRAEASLMTENMMTRP